MRQVCGGRPGGRVMQQRRDGCWRWPWCWRADRVQRQRRRQVWTVRRCATGFTAITRKAWPGSLTAGVRLAPSDGSRPSRRLKSPSGSGAAPTWPSTGWSAGGAPIWPARSRRGSGSCWPNAVWAMCCGGSGFGGWWRVLAIPAKTLRHRRLSGKLCRPRRGAAAGARPRQAARALVARRGSHWPAGHAHPCLGRARLASGRAPRPALFLGLPVRRDLPRARHGRSAGAAGG